jgi:CHRD domain-containing protein
MNTTARRAAGFLAAAIVLICSVYAIAGQSRKQTVKADALSGYHENPTLSTSATGSFTADIDDDSQTITYELTYSGLSAPAAVAHIHFGSRYTNGNVSVFFCGGGGKPSCPAGTTAPAVVTGTIVPADVIGPAGQGIAAGEFDELVAAIRAGMTYANVHTSIFPGGEIRGQINDQNQRQP